MKKMWSGRFREPIDPGFERWQRSFVFDRRLLPEELQHHPTGDTCLDRDLLHFKQHIALRYAELVYYGFWFTPLREALDAFVKPTQASVTGRVVLKLYKGNVTVAARCSPYSLYCTDLAAFTMGDGYNPKDAEGFIRTLGLPARMQARLRQKGNL